MSVRLGDVSEIRPIFYEKDFSDYRSTQNFTFVVERYSHTAQGGPKQAVMTAYAGEIFLWEIVELLRCPVIIENRYSENVWWGFVNEVEVRVGGLSVGLSLDNMYNRIRVVYTDSNERNETSWAEDTDSSGEYGLKELSLTIGDISASTAEQSRDTKLEQLKYPIPTIRLPAQQGGALSARVICKGWLDALDWKYYSQPKGYVAHTETGVGAQVLSISYTANTIYFSTASYGSAEDGSQRQAYRIQDTASGLSAFKKDTWVYVKGSKNSGSYFVNQGTSTGFGITVDQPFSQGDTASNGGATYTITSACKVNQAFKQTSGSAWNVHQVWARLQNVNDVASVGGSGVIAEIRSSISGSIDTASTVATGSVPASDIGENMAWTKFTLDASATLSNNTEYWMSFYEVGTPSGCSYYKIDVSEKLGYGDGAMEINNGNSRHSRFEDADLLFKIIGESETTCQLTQIEQSYGQFFKEIYIDDSSSRMSPQYRDGETTALVEFMELLNQGTINNKRLLASVDERRNIFISEESGSTDEAPWRFDVVAGKFYDQYGRPVRRSKIKAGVWVMLDNFTISSHKFIKDITTFFMEEVEYFTQSQEIVPIPRGQTPPFEIGDIIEDG